MNSRLSIIRRSMISVGLVVLGIVSTSCKPDPIDEDKDNVLGKFDGLWVEQVKGGSTIVPHIDIKGNEAILCKSRPFEYDYTDRVPGVLQYNGLKNKGVINFSDGTVLNFLCDELGNFCSADTLAYYKINTTLDALQEELNSTPRLTLGPDYVGPDHDLGIDLSCKPLLAASNLEAGGAWYVDLLKFAGESFMKGAISWAGGKSLEAIVSCFYTDPTSEKLDNILTQVNEINNKLAEIEQLIHDTTYEKYINDRTNYYCNPLTNYSKSYINALAEAQINKADSLTIARIVNEWHDTDPAISGLLGGPMDAASNYMDFLMTTIVEHSNNIYNVYDIYTFNAVPWENMGYDFRQSLRAVDLALIQNNMKLALLYAAIHHWESDIVHKTYIDDLQAKWDKFYAFCHTYTVDVKDEAVCQIANAHFAMKKKMIFRDFNFPANTWYPVGSRFYHGESTTSDLVYYGGRDMSIEQFRQKQITPDELTAMVKYYSDPSMSVQRMLGQAGVEIFGQILILNGETTADWDDWLWCYHVQLNNEDDYRYPRYSKWLTATTHWSMSFSYWFDGWKYREAYGGCTDILYRY